MARVAFFTFGVLREPMDDPQSRGFVDRIAGSFAEAAASPGFLGFPRQTLVRPNTPDVAWPAAKGAHDAMMTLSLWADLASVFAFAYRREGVHNEALKRRKEWFLKPEWPNYVAWWVEDGHQPTWREAAERHARLSAHGPTADAFDFHHPFDAEGRPLPTLRRPMPLELAPHR